MAARLTDRVGALLEPSVSGLGYELVGVEMVAATLRVYIDSPAGITVDDCAKVSRQVSTVLDVEDPIQGHYTLEVSSPGIDRPLFGAADYERFAGSRVKIQMATPRPLDGRRRFEGLLGGLRDGTVIVTDADDEHRLELADIARARLVGEL